MAITTTLDGKMQTWKDGKRYLWLLGIVVPLLPFAAWREATRFDLSIFWWLGPIWILILIPLLDAVFGEDTSNAPEWAVEQLANDRYYRWCTYVFIPVQYASLVYACWVVTHTEMHWYDIVGYSLTVGTVAGIAINTAHELGHKSPEIERRFAKIALAQSAYGHFCVEHKRDLAGRYERCEPEHSWNSNHIASNVVLYQLERHSDHHAHPTRRYQALRHFDESPQLPSGYGLMLGLAYVPPIWRRVMDKRVLAHYHGDVALANIHPRTRSRVLHMYGPTTASTPRPTRVP